MRIRIFVMTAVVALVIPACSSDDDRRDADVPDDQELQPISAPSGWSESDLDALTVAAPSELDQDEDDNAQEGVTGTTWRDDDSADPPKLGMTIRVFDSPKNDAEDAAQNLALTSVIGAGADKAPDTHEIEWPGASSAYYLSFESELGDSGQKEEYVTRMVVLDMASGQQVQGTSLAQKAESTDLTLKLLGTIQLNESDN